MCGAVAVLILIAFGVIYACWQSANVRKAREGLVLAGAIQHLVVTEWGEFADGKVGERLRSKLDNTVKVSDRKPTQRPFVVVTLFRGDMGRCISISTEPSRKLTNVVIVEGRPSNVPEESVMPNPESIQSVDYVFWK
jgi:hypothetical protein